MLVVSRQRANRSCSRWKWGAKCWRAVSSTLHLRWSKGQAPIPDLILRILTQIHRHQFRSKATNTSVRRLDLSPSFRLMIALLWRTCNSKSCSISEVSIWMLMKRENNTRMRILSGMVLMLLKRESTYQGHRHLTLLDCDSLTLHSNHLQLLLYSQIQQGHLSPSQSQWTQFSSPF